MKHVRLILRLVFLFFGGLGGYTLSDAIGLKATTAVILIAASLTGALGLGLMGDE